MSTGFQITQLSMHPYGCRVIQRVLEHCSEEQKRPVLEALHANMSTLIVDQYGNYVVQHVIEHGSNQDRDRIVQEVTASRCQKLQDCLTPNVLCYSWKSKPERPRLKAIKPKFKMTHYEREWGFFFASHQQSEHTATRYKHPWYEY